MHDTFEIFAQFPGNLGNKRFLFKANIPDDPFKGRIVQAYPVEEVARRTAGAEIVRDIGDAHVFAIDNKPAGWPEESRDHEGRKGSVSGLAEPS